jgi:hypothetical protein
MGSLRPCSESSMNIPLSVCLSASPFLRLREHFVATVAESGHHELERAGEDGRSPGSYLLPSTGVAIDIGGRLQQWWAIPRPLSPHRWRISTMNDPVDNVHGRPLPLST